MSCAAAARPVRSPTMTARARTTSTTAQTTNAAVRFVWWLKCTRPSMSSDARSEPECGTRVRAAKYFGRRCPSAPEPEPSHNTDKCQPLHVAPQSWVISQGTEASAVTCQNMTTAPKGSSAGCTLRNFPILRQLFSGRLCRPAAVSTGVTNCNWLQARPRSRSATASAVPVCAKPPAPTAPLISLCAVRRTRRATAAASVAWGLTYAPSPSVRSPTSLTRTWASTAVRSLPVVCIPVVQVIVCSTILLALRLAVHWLAIPMNGPTAKAQVSTSSSTCMTWMVSFEISLAMPSSQHSPSCSVVFHAPPAALSRLKPQPPPNQILSMALIKHPYPDLDAEPNPDPGPPRPDPDS